MGAACIQIMLLKIWWGYTKYTSKNLTQIMNGCRPIWDVKAKGGYCL